MGIMSELFKSPFHGPEQAPAGFDDGLVEPGLDFDPNFVPVGPWEAIDGSSGMTYGSDAFDTHDPNADPFGIGRDMEPEAYIGEAQRLVEEFSGNDELTLEALIQRRFYEFRAELRTRPWFRILCDAKLMLDESRATWADRRHRAFLALGLRKAPTQPCQHCFHENGAGSGHRHHSVGYPHHDTHPGFASPGMGGFVAEDRSSEVASAIQSMSFQVANSSYGVNRAVRAMEQAVAVMARGSHPYGHQATSGVVQHIPSAPFPVYQRPVAGLSPVPGMGDFAEPMPSAENESPTGDDGLADFVPNEPSLDSAQCGPASGRGGSVVIVGGGGTPVADDLPPDASATAETAAQAPEAPAEAAVSAPGVTPDDVPLVASDASLSVDADVLRGEIAGTIKRLEQALEALKRQS